MKKWIRPLAVCLAGFSLLCGVVPLFFGVRNAGTVGLVCYGGGLLLLCWLWNRFNGRGRIVRRLRAVSDLRTHVPRWWRNLRRLAAVGFALAFVGGAGLSVWMFAYAYGTPPAEHATVIVLGCQVVDGQPSKMLQLRLDAAYEYLIAYPESVMIGSGGTNLIAPDDPSEGAVMKSYLTGRGIDPERIFVEEQSHSTQQNLAFSREIIAANELPETVVIASDGFHQLRAALYAGKCGLSASPLPSTTPWGLLPSYLVREWFAIAKLVVLD